MKKPSLFLILLALLFALAVPGMAADGPFTVEVPVEIALEILVIPVEGLLYRAAKKSGFSFPKPFLLALICNLSSYSFGLVLNAVRAAVR